MIQLLQKVVCVNSPLKKLMLFIFLAGYFNTSDAASFYWVDGSGNWKNYSQHWATASGGSSFYDHEPASADDVFFDQHSFPSGGILTIDVNATCKNLTWSPTSSMATVSGTSGSLSIYGSLALTNHVNWDYLGNILFAGSGRGKTIKTAACQLRDVYLEGSGAEWILQDAISCNSLSLMSGNLKTNDRALYCSHHITSWGDTLELGASLVHCMFWTNYMNDATSFDAGTSTIYCFQFSGIHQSYDHLRMINSTGYSIFISTSCTFEDAVFPEGETDFYDASNNLFGKALFKGKVTLNGNAVFKNATFRDDCFLNDTNVFDTVTFDNPGKTISFESGKKQTVNDAMHIYAAAQNRIALKSSTAGSSAFLSFAIPELCFEYLAVQDITISGGTLFKAGIHSTDLGNNSGCFFTSCSLPLDSSLPTAIKNNGLLISELYPNPVNSLAYFQIACDHRTRFLIVRTDCTGKELSRTISTVDAGSFIISNDFNDHAPGVYFIKISDQETGRIVMRKIVKQ
jgi:hypothetical protein